MKAIRVHEFGGPDVLRLDEVLDPKPGAGQIVVRVRAVGVNPVDTYIRSGTYVFRPPLPYTPGMEAAGEVESVGEGVTKFRTGARVYIAGSISGAYAERALCDAAQVYPLPDAITYEQGAGIPIPYGTAHRALFGRGNAQGGETVLVHGASGGVGIAALQIARNAGLRVIGTAGTKEGLELIAKHGAEFALDHGDAKHLDRCKEITGGRGVDIILEMLANVNLGAELPYLAPKGRVVVIGNRGTVEIDARALMSRDADIRGMSLLNITAAERDAIHAQLHAGLANGTLSPVVSREFPLAQAAEAQRAVMESHTLGKLVLGV